MSIADLPAPKAAGSFSEPMEVSDSQTLDEIYALRARVWRATGEVCEEAFAGGWRDADDLHAGHWVIRDRIGQIVASARLTIHRTLSEVPEAEEYLRYGLDLAGPIAAPARIVVCPSTQGHGLGRKLLDVQDRAAHRLGARHAVRQASPAMVRLLVHRGWRIVGPAKTDPRFPGVSFQVALLELPSAFCRGDL